MTLASVAAIGNDSHLLRQHLQNVCRAVCTPVIDDNDILTEGHDIFHNLADSAGIVVGGNDDADVT